jgi:hypothetical protein
MKKSFKCRIGLHKWEYSTIRNVRYCWRLGCDAKQLHNGRAWVNVVVLVLALAGFLFAANDSASAYYDTVQINWKRSVQSITRDTASKNATLGISPQAMQWLQTDTTNGIQFNTFGANNIWKKNKQENDSAMGKSMRDLIDTVFTHAGKYLKKQAK